MNLLRPSTNFARSLLIHSYSTVGLRTNVDFMIWRIGYELEPIQEMTSRLNKTEMAKYIEPSQSFLSMTKRSMYIDKDNPEHVEDRLHIVPGKSQYLFVYPFVKTREWYSRTGRATAGDDGRAYPHRLEVPFSKTSHHLFLRTRRSGVCCRF